MSIIFRFLRRHLVDRTAYSISKYSPVPISTVQRWKMAQSDRNETLDSVEAILDCVGFEIVDEGDQLTIRRRPGTPALAEAAPASTPPRRSI